MGHKLEHELGMVLDIDIRFRRRNGHEPGRPTSKAPRFMISDSISAEGEI